MKEKYRVDDAKTVSISGLEAVNKMLSDTKKLNTPLITTVLQAQRTADRMTKLPLVSAWLSTKSPVLTATDAALFSHYAASQKRISNFLETSAIRDVMTSTQSAAMVAKSLQFSSSSHWIRFLSNATSFYNNSYNMMSGLDTAMGRIYEMLKKNNFSEYGFEVSEEDELQIETYDLISNPSIIIPEKRVILLKELTHVEKTITAIYHDNSQLYNVHHREFEEMIAELLKSRGFEVHLTKQTRDGGKDIIALQNMNGFPLKILVECKKNAPHRKIGIDIIQRFGNVVNSMKANKGVIFTTSYFSKDAKKEKDTYMPYLLDLKDRNDVIDWIKEYVE